MKDHSEFALPFGGVVSYWASFLTPFSEAGLQVMGVFFLPRKRMIISSGEGAGDMRELGI